MAQLKFGVLVFPGSNGDTDCLHLLNTVLGVPTEAVWHGERRLAGYDCLILPGGFAYGDYLRCGAIARFSPIMGAVGRHAAAGRPVFGICNGFQVLCEAGLLPGALMRNDVLQFRCEWVNLRVETTRSSFTAACASNQVLRMPISHGEGNYYAAPDVLSTLCEQDRVAFRYCAADGTITPGVNPNGSLQNIAGILSEGRNVLGMMPHPERASEELTGGVDGLLLWRSLIESFVLSR